MIGGFPGFILHCVYLEILGKPRAERPKTGKIFFSHPQRLGGEERSILSCQESNHSLSDCPSLRLVTVQTTFALLGAFRTLKLFQLS
jgi:hypothetical protein